MSKSQFKTFLIFALLISNLTLIGFQFFLKPERRHRPPNPKTIVVKRLGLDAKQQKDYSQLIQKHQHEIQKRDLEINRSKKLLFEHLNSETTSHFNDSICTRIGQIQAQIESEHLAHFQNVRKLCRPDQLPKFEKLSKDLARIFSPKPPRR